VRLISLRYIFIGNLDEERVYPKVAQMLGGCCTITLTMGRSTYLEPRVPLEASLTSRFWKCLTKKQGEAGAA